MALVYESELLDFSADETIPTVVNHNLGVQPVVVSFTGVDGANLGFPMLKDANDNQIPGPRIEGADDINSLSVYKPNAYTYAGKFKIQIYT